MDGSRRRGLGSQRWVRALGVLLAITLGCVSSSAHAQPAFRGPFDAYAASPRTVGQVAPTVPRGLVVAGVDRQRGVPTMLLGSASPGRGIALPPLHAGLAHLVALAPLYGVSVSAQTIELALARPTPGGGSLMVFRQRVGGVEVFETRLALLVDSQGNLRVAGGQLQPSSSRGFVFSLDEAAAVTTALADCWGEPTPRASLVEPLPSQSGGGDALFGPSASAAARGVALDAPARARRVLFPLPTRLVPATYVELWVTDPVSGPILVAYVVSAEDGRVLMRRSLTANDSFSYSVYGDATAPFQPLDSPFGDTSPDLAGAPVAMPPSLIGQTTVSIEGLNRGPSGSADPWLPPGATETRGNNVDAYADLRSPDGFTSGDLRASTTAPGAFEHFYDPSAQPDASNDQRSAAITHLFYVNNWLHDWFYGVGFDEAAGNAQDDNFARGGEEGDHLRAEAMDYAGTNNANMSTPRDGSSPRMQMFLWSGYRTASVESGATTYDVGTASFGPSTFDVTAPIAIAIDGTAPTSDACEAITNDLTGQIAIIDRGGCNFISKINAAGAAGAVGVLIVNNVVGGGTISMGGTGTTTLPALMVSLEDGAALRAALGAMARLERTSLPRAASSLDTQVVAHEWGHYLHHRLVSCGSHQCSAQSEGWGDFIAILSLVRPRDDLTGAYANASYSNQGSAAIYFGTRRLPYSPSRAFDDLSFRHISDGESLPTTHPLDPSTRGNSEVHNAGEVWATMMFDALVAILERSRGPGAPYSFEEARTRFASYVVTGMQLAPRNPTYTEQRDGVIAAALETDLEDARLIATAFAGRGAGTCAIAPDRDSDDLTGVVEDFSLGARPTIEELTVETGGASRLCDADAILDQGERGEVRVVVRNDGLVDFAGVVLLLDADDPAIAFPTGAMAAVADLAPGMRQEILVPIEVTDGVSVAGPVTFRATLGAAGICADVVLEARVTVDRDEAIGELETFEVTPAWLAESSLDRATTGVWSVGPSRLGDSDWVLRGVDTSSITDTAVELPEVTVSTSAPLVLGFEHRFRFEAEPTVLWDGGVIELSTDGGVTWEDVETLVDPGYTGALTDSAMNPLSFRRAYSGTNPSSPAADTVRLDFGTALAGMRVRFRFRIGTDQASGDTGWEIDDLSITGGDPAPFPVFAADVADCANAPSADAGPDQTVVSLDLVTLDATGSTDPNGDALFFAWEQIGADPLVTLSNIASVTPTFTAPLVASATDVVLRVRVSDGAGSSTDEVRVRIQPPPMADAGPPSPDAGRPRADAGTSAGSDAGVPDGGEPMAPEGGCSCRIRGRRDARSSLGLALVACVGLWLRRRARRLR